MSEKVIYLDFEKKTRKDPKDRLLLVCRYHLNNILGCTLVYNKEATDYFLENTKNLYPFSEDPVTSLESFIKENQEDLRRVIKDYGEDYFFFSQPEIFIILQNLVERKYDLVYYWSHLYPQNELEEIANIWGTSIF